MKRLLRRTSRKHLWYSVQYSTWYSATVLVVSADLSQRRNEIEVTPGYSTGQTKSMYGVQYLYLYLQAKKILSILLRTPFREYFPGNRVSRFHRVFLPAALDLPVPYRQPSPQVLHSSVNLSGGY